MKKLLALILALLMLASVLVGCGETPDNSDDSTDTDNPASTDDTPSFMTFEAGYGRAKFTPDFAVALTGSGAPTPTSSVYNDLFASCTAIKDGDGTTLLIYSIDAQFIYDETCDTLKVAITEATKVPAENILINFTHTHYAPNFMNNKDAYTLLEAAAVNAAKTAIVDLAPATIYTGEIVTEGLVFIRRFYDKNSDGKTTANEIETEPNNSLYLIKLDREGKKDIVLANFASHATITHQQKISADYIGVAREKFERTYCKDAYLSIQMGACGDAIAWEYTDQGNSLVRDPDFMGIEAYGDTLAKYAADGLATLTEHKTEKGIKISVKEISLVVDHSRDALKTDAARIVNEWDTNHAVSESLMKKHGITSKEEAGAIWRRADLPTFNKMELAAISVGDIAIVAAPYEMFTDNGRNIRTASGYEFNFVLGYTNGFHVYIPTSFGFDNGGYEALNCNYVKGSAEKIQDELIKMLEKLSE